jgi:hypothetical protein
MVRVCMARQSIPKALVGRDMTVIPAVILGGASIFGGEGSVFGTVCAIALITVVSNSMLLIGIDTYWQDFFNGLVILIGVTVSAAAGSCGRSANGRRETMKLKEFSTRDNRYTVMLVILAAVPAAVLHDHEGRHALARWAPGSRRGHAVPGIRS